MFLVIGVLGALALALVLVFDDVLEGIIPDSDWLSSASIATFLVAFGFGTVLLETGTGLRTGPAATGGLAAGLALGGLAARWGRSLSRMRTDATPTAADLVGCPGRVVTTVAPGSTGEALVRLAGQQVKLTASVAGDTPTALEHGTPIVVVDVLSPTRVEVQPAEDFWA